MLGAVGRKSTMLLHTPVDRSTDGRKPMLHALVLSSAEEKTISLHNMCVTTMRDKRSAKCSGHKQCIAPWFCTHQEEVKALLHFRLLAAFSSAYHPRPIRMSAASPGLTARS